MLHLLLILAKRVDGSNFRVEDAFQDELGGGIRPSGTFDRLKR